MVKTTEFNVQTQMNYVVGNMSGFTAAYTGMDNLSALISSLMTSYTTMAGTGRAAYLSLGAAVAAFGLKSSEAFGEYQRGMNMVKAISNNTNAQMQMLSQSAQQFSSQFRMGIEDINSGLVTLGRAGLTDVNNQIEVLKNGLEVAKISGMDLASTLEDIVTTTSLLGGDIKSNTFGAETKEVSNLLVATSLSGPLDVSDVIETLKFAGGSAAAAGAKLSNEEGLHDLLGTIGAFSQKGVTGSIAGTALRAFITKPASQDQKVSDALARLGLDAYSLWEKDPEQGWHMKPIAEQIGMITKAMDKNHLTNLDRIEVWGDIVGNKMGQQMLKLDEGRIKETTRDIEHQRNLEEIYQGTLTNFASQVERLNQIFQAIYRNFGSQFASTLTPIVEFLANVAEFINGINNGMLIKLFASVVGPLGLAGLAKGLRDFLQVLGALKANITRSSEESLGSQDLWVAQRGVIEKRMSKGETIIAHDEWSKFLKPKSSYSGDNGDYQARMEQREADYKKRQDERDKDYYRRQEEKDKFWKERREKSSLNKLSTMSVGARIVKVFGSAIQFNSNMIKTDGSLPVAPMSDSVAQEIANRDKIDSETEKTFKSHRKAMNNMIGRQGEMSTSFSHVDMNSIVLPEDFNPENTVFTPELMNHLVQLEKGVRSGLGMTMLADSQSMLYNFEDIDDTINELKDITPNQRMRIDLNTPFLKEEGKTLLHTALKKAGMPISPIHLQGIVHDQFGAMIDNFIKHGTNKNLFSFDEETGHVTLKKGQEEAFAEKLSENVMGFIGQRLAGKVNLKEFYEPDYKRTLQKSGKDANEYSFDKYLIEKLQLKKGESIPSDYEMPLVRLLHKGMDMEGHNAFMARFDPDEYEPGVIEGIEAKKIFTHLGLISQKKGMLSEITDILHESVNDAVSDEVMSKSMQAEIDDIKKPIENVGDMKKLIKTHLTDPVNFGAHEFETHGLLRKSPGLMARAVQAEMRDIREAFLNNNSFTQSARALGQSITQAFLSAFNSVKTVFETNSLYTLLQNEFNRLLELTNMFSAQFKIRMQYAGQMGVIGWRTGTGIWSPGYIYTYTAGEFRGLNILLNKFKSTFNKDGQEIGHELQQGFKSSSNFKDLVDDWLSKGYITNKQAADLKRIKNSTLEQLYNVDKNGEEHGLLTTHELKDIKPRRFQGNEKITPLYQDGKATVNAGEYYVIDTESNTMTESAEKQITQYTRRREINGKDRVVNTYINSARAISKSASELTGITQEMLDNSYSEAQAYDLIAKDLLQAVNSGKAIVAHNAAYDKSNVISNLSRVASLGLLDGKKYNIKDKEGNFIKGDIYDAIEHINNGKWIDTAGEISPYRNATYLDGEYIFWDEIEKRTSVANGIAYEALTGKKRDPSKQHDAIYDTRLTKAIMEALIRSLEGGLVTGNTYANTDDPNQWGRDLDGNLTAVRKRDNQILEAHDELLKVRGDFFKEIEIRNTQEAVIAKKLFREMYDPSLSTHYEKQSPYYLSKKEQFIKDYGKKLEDLTKTQEATRKKEAKYNNDRTWAFMNQGRVPIISPHPSAIQGAQLVGIKVNDDDTSMEAPNPSRTSGSGKNINYNPYDRSAELAKEKEILDQIDSYTFETYVRKFRQAQNSSLVISTDMILDSESFQKILKKHNGYLRKALEEWEPSEEEFGLFLNQIETTRKDILSKYGDRIEDITVDDLRKSASNGTIGTEYLFEGPANNAREILQAIRNKLHYSEVTKDGKSLGALFDENDNFVEDPTKGQLIYNGKPIEDAYNIVKGRALSQNEVLILLSRGKFFTKGDNIGYINQDGDFQPLISYRDLEAEDQGFIAKKYNEYIDKGFDHNESRRMAFKDLADERFQSNEHIAETLEEEMDPANVKDYYVPKKNFNKSVMEYMKLPIPELINKYNAIFGQEILSLDGDNVVVKSPITAEHIGKQIAEMEELFYNKYTEGVFYYSEQRGGKNISSGSFHPFEKFPGVQQLLDDYDNLNGSPYILRDNSEFLENIEMLQAQQANGDKEAIAKLEQMKRDFSIVKNVHENGDSYALRKAQALSNTYNEAQNQGFDNELNQKLMKDYVVNRLVDGKIRKGIGAPQYSNDELYDIMNSDIKTMANNAINSFDTEDMAIIKDRFKKAIQELPIFVQKMIQQIIREASSFKEAMELLGKEGVDGFRIGTKMSSPPAVFTELIRWVHELPSDIVASTSKMQAAGALLGESFADSFKKHLFDFYVNNINYDKLVSKMYGTVLPQSSSSMQKYFGKAGANALSLSDAYNSGDITQSQYLNKLFKSFGISTERKLMTSDEFTKNIAQIKEQLFADLSNENISALDARNKAKSSIEQQVAQYEDDKRIQGIRDRAVSDEQFIDGIKALDTQYKNSVITLEEYIEETMLLMGVEERRLMTEEDLANKLIDIKNKLAAGDITEVEAEQGIAHLENTFKDDLRTAKERKIKQERQDRIDQGGIKGAAWGRWYGAKDAMSKAGGFTGLTNSLFSLMMHPAVMLGQMALGLIQQGVEYIRQGEQERTAKLSEILSSATSAFDDQKSKWEEAQSKNNEKFGDLSDNEKQDQMLDAMANARDDLNNASAETKVLLGKQNALITANTNMIQSKSDQILTGYNGLQANYTEFMEGSGMYGTKDEFGFMDFLESIINPDKFADNSNTRRIEALAESSIQIDTRVKNMEEFTEDYQQVMASLGIAGRSILDIYNVRGIIDENLMSGTFFDQSASNQMRIGAPGLMSAEKLAGLMKTQEKILTRFENRYLRFVKTSTGQGNRIGVTLGDGSIHQLANQLGVKDIEAAQMLAVHELQRIQDVMINQVAPQLSEQTLSLYNGTYDLSQQTQYDNVQTAFQNTMQQGIWAIQAQVAQLVYKATMEQALADYQAETGDTETDTIGLLLNRARDTTYEHHDAAQKYASRGWGSFLEGRDINKLVNEGYTQEQAIQKLAEEKGVSVDKLTEAYAKENYDKLSEYEYNGQVEWLKRHAGQFLTIGGTIVGAAVGTMAMPGVGTALGIEAGSTMGTILGGTAGQVIGGGIGAAAGAGISSGIMDGYQNAMGSWTDFSDPFTEHTNEMMKSYAESVPIDETIKTLNDAQTAADEEGDNGKDTDDSDANKQRYVQLAICNKKAIPKLNVNLFKKAPTFTVLNKNFKLRDIKINTADKAKNIENSLKNAIIDVQERSDPKIIQDSEGEYDPVGATDDATNLPTGASLTK